MTSYLVIVSSKSVYETPQEEVLREGLMELDQRRLENFLSDDDDSPYVRLPHSNTIIIRLPDDTGIGLDGRLSE